MNIILKRELWANIVILIFVALEKYYKLDHHVPYNDNIVIARMVKEPPM